jgi:hypothetical protein
MTQDLQLIMTDFSSTAVLPENFCVDNNESN